MIYDNIVSEMQFFCYPCLERQRGAKVLVFCRVPNLEGLRFLVCLLALLRAASSLGGRCTELWRKLLGTTQRLAVFAASFATSLATACSE